jgi:hypothetical protein
MDRLSNDGKMNSSYFMTNILIPLEHATFAGGRAPHQKRLVSHLDNCPLHIGRASSDWLEEHDICRMPQPSYRLNLASSDFYLFPIPKEKLEWTQLADEDEFLNLCKRF